MSNACTLKGVFLDDAPPLSPHQQQMALAAIWYDNISPCPPRMIVDAAGGHHFEPWMASAGIGGTSDGAQACYQAAQITKGEQ
jgi:hypothetical protein